jgi:hypothetical protein
MTFVANDKAISDQVREKLAVLAKESGNKATLRSSMGIKNFQTVNGRSRITFEDGSVIKGVRELKIDLEVYTPPLKRLRLSSKYEEVDVQVEVSEWVDLDLYSSELQLGDITGELKMKAPYSKGQVGRFGNGQIELYESKIEFGAGKDLILNAKYSSFLFPKVGKLQVESYESEGQFREIGGSMLLKDKYSTLSFGPSQDALMDLYESKLKIRSAGKVQLKSKYSDFEVGTMEQLNFETSYEDELEIERLGKLSASDSKYGKFRIGELTESIAIAASYEDKINIGRVGSNLRSLAITGKYTELEAPIPGSMKYMFQLKGRYTKTDLDETDLDYSKYVAKGDELNLVGKKPGTGPEAAKLTFDCYNCKLMIK